MDTRKAVSDHYKLPGKFGWYAHPRLGKIKVYLFPLLKKGNSRGNEMTWQVLIRVDKLPSPISKLYNSFPLKTNAYYWTISKEKEGSRISAETEISSGKNLGKANETNSFTQALSEAYSLHMDKIKKGYSESGRIDKSVRKPPMLLYRYDRYKNKVCFPAYIQRKRDGILYCMARNAKSGIVEVYSRNRIVYKNTVRQEKELKKIFDKYPTLELYGEAYEHGKSLQEISGIVRNENSDNRLSVYIFDCVPKGNPDMPYTKRWSYLKKIFEEFPDMKYIKKVKTYKVENEKEMMKLYKRFMKEGYEGGIYRNPIGKYKYSWTSSRSWEVLKIKPRKSDEFKIVGFKDGNGKNSGLVTFIMQTSDGKKFNAEPNMPEDIRRKLFKEFNKDFYYRDKMATIEYSELSDRGVPQQPKFITVRDYE